MNYEQNRARPSVSERLKEIRAERAAEKTALQRSQQVNEFPNTTSTSGLSGLVGYWVFVWVLVIAVLLVALKIIDMVSWVATVFGY